MIRWFKLAWRYSHVKAWIIFAFKFVNSIRYLRQKVVFFIGLIHFFFFFSCIGLCELFFLYWMLWELAGPQIDTYQDYDPADPESIDYIPPRSESTV